MHFKHNFFLFKKSVEDDPVRTPPQVWNFPHFFFDGFPKTGVTRPQGTRPHGAAPHGHHLLSGVAVYTGDDP